MNIYLNDKHKKLYPILHIQASTGCSYYTEITIKNVVIHPLQANGRIYIFFRIRIETLYGHAIK